MILNRSQIDNINRIANEKEKNSLMGKFLPVLLFVSFVFVSFFDSYSSFTHSAYSVSNVANMVFGFDDLLLVIIVNGLIKFAVFELLFFLYRQIVRITVIGYSLPVEAIKNLGRFYMMLSNIFLGCVLNLRFICPELIAFEELIEMVITISMFAAFMLRVMRKYVHDIAKGQAFSVLTVPYFVFEGIYVLRLVVGVL